MAAMSALPESALLSDARRRVQALQARLQAEDGGTVRLIETHISWVLLGSTHAWKLKKPVRLPFLDFSSLRARRHYCEEELRLNRRLAPGLYLDVVEVRAAPEPRLDGQREVVDVAVRMRRFPDGALWSEQVAAGTLSARQVDGLARRLARFHRDADHPPPGSDFGSAAAHVRVTRNLMASIDAMQPPGAWPRLRQWLEDALPALAPVWDARRRAGRVRECHGDLHLANVVQLGEESTGFDAIEFDDELRWIDVLDDIAFPVMDLLAHDRDALAWRLLDGWLEDSGDHDGVPALRFYLVRRALVRWMIRAMGPGGRSPDYLALAERLARGADPRLAITHGLPGSGKSFVSQGLLEAAGAIRLRSDVERKRLFGLGAQESSHGHVPGGIYDAATTARTYARLHHAARVALSAGWPVIVDAAFLRRDERMHFASLAESMSVPFAIVECRAPWSLLRQRVARRQTHGSDASEADLQVLERLRTVDEPLADAEVLHALAVDASDEQPASALAARWLASR
jgi:aminoglycoside phosphotransferase family enzyme/predicted kinase